MIVKQRAPTPAETEVGGLVTVLTVADRGLLCEDCGWDTRVDVHVYADPAGTPIITLTGCTKCRSGLYGPPL